MSTTVFTKIARLVRVRDIQESLRPTLDAGQRIFDALDYLEGPGGRSFGFPDASLVKEEGKTIGWTSFYGLLSAVSEVGENGPAFAQEEAQKARVGDRMLPITVDSVLTADLTAFGAAKLLAEGPHSFFWVMEENQITGTLTYSDLFKPPFRLCILSLTLELEETTLRLAVESAQQSWDALPPNRQAAAIENLRRRGQLRRQNGEEHFPSPYQALQSTSFVDKKIILERGRLLPDVDGQELREVFDRAHKVRNQCAHPELEWDERVMPKDQLWRFIAGAHHLMRQMNDALDGAES